jgi:hypothetical protein
VAILRHTSTLVAASAATEDWKLNTLETHKSLTDVVVRGRVDCATLGVSEELIQRIVCSTLPDLVVVVKLLRLVYSVIDGTISRVLGWASIKSSWSTAWVLLAVTSIGAKSTIGILVSTRCSGKRLQVSDHCSSLLDVERK